MPLRIDLEDVCDTYRLCFVRAPWAWFTRLEPGLQWGDHWERAPWQQHAGPPYRGEPDPLLRVAFDGPLLAPGDGEHGGSYSVQEINRGSVPWLRTDSYFGGKPVVVMAGSTLREFVEAIDKIGATVYAPLGWGDLPEAPRAALRDG